MIGEYTTKPTKFRIHRRPGAQIIFSSIVEFGLIIILYVKALNQL